MSILGTLVDKHTVSRVGDALIGLTFASVIHSLPATTPETVVPVLQSMQANMGASPVLLGVGGNQSVSTIGIATPTTFGSVVGSMPTISYNVIASVFHSLIR